MRNKFKPLDPFPEYGHVYDEYPIEIFKINSEEFCKQFYLQEYPHPYLNELSAHELRFRLKIYNYEWSGNILWVDRYQPGNNIHLVRRLRNLYQFYLDIGCKPNKYYRKVMGI